MSFAQQILTWPKLRDSHQEFTSRVGRRGAIFVAKPYHSRTVKLMQTYADRILMTRYCLPFTCRSRLFCSIVELRNEDSQLSNVVKCGRQTQQTMPLTNHAFDMSLFCFINHKIWAFLMGLPHYCLPSEDSTSTDATAAWLNKDGQT